MGWLRNTRSSTRPLLERQVTVNATTGVASCLDREVCKVAWHTDVVPDQCGKFDLPSIGNYMVAPETPEDEDPEEWFHQLLRFRCHDLPNKGSYRCDTLS